MSNVALGKTYTLTTTISSGDGGRLTDGYHPFVAGEPWLVCTSNGIIEIDLGAIFTARKFKILLLGALAASSIEYKLGGGAWLSFGSVSSASAAGVANYQIVTNASGVMCDKIRLNVVRSGGTATIGEISVWDDNVSVLLDQPLAVGSAGVGEALPIAVEYADGRGVSSRGAIVQTVPLRTYGVGVGEALPIAIEYADGRGVSSFAKLVNVSDGGARITSQNAVFANGKITATVALSKNAGLRAWLLENGTQISSVQDSLTPKLEHEFVFFVAQGRSPRNIKVELEVSRE
jgi:hypothetical protein